ncbi:BACON domain-containing protein [Streptomyces sp. AA0539]|uniref:BACON domain-containing protein n=1 Tax=Streptomyces sp. AA0539 TaxID=1210045 RepID=UPI0002F1B096|nr:sigma-70 family RNA polymerase sigma factor [Streptomyces sp. AA0539]
MNSCPERSARTTTRTRPAAATGAHRVPRRRAAENSGPDRRRRGGPAAYEDAYLDGLFTYCLSIMCEHDTATAALGEALALAQRQHDRGRRPAAPGQSRAWLYALARWSCLRRLAAQREAGTPPQPRAAGTAGADAQLRRRELAALAWPEAAGTSPEQREALELAVRHQLSPAEVALVLRLSVDAATALLTSGACEVERTRAALAAVDAGGCTTVASLAGEDRLMLLRPGLRRELVGHVDGCPACRRAAQRAMAGVTWPGTAPGEARLTVLAAPRAAVHAALLVVERARAQYTPRFDRAGFPLTEKDRAARRERLRSRAVTTTVVATVLAAPALALWAAYRGASVTGEASGQDASATEDDRGLGAAGGDDYAYENTGRWEESPPPDADGGRSPAGEATEEADGAERDDPAPDEDTGPGTAAPSPDGRGGRGDGGTRPAQPGRLTVDAVSTARGTEITLTASGGAPVQWNAVWSAQWLTLSATSGTLEPGESVTLVVTVDRDREPSGPWQGRITIEPAGATITIEGNGPASPEPSEPPPTEEPAPEPTDPAPSDPPPADPSPTDPV